MNDQKVCSPNVLGWNAASPSSFGFASDQEHYKEYNPTKPYISGRHVGMESANKLQQSGVGKGNGSYQLPRDLDLFSKDITANLKVYARRNGLDENGFDDLFQEVYIRLFRLDPPRPCHSKSELLGYVRTTAFRCITLILEQQLQVGDMDSVAQDKNKTMFSEEIEAIKEALDGMTQELRSLIELTYFQGLTLEEIAVQKGASKSNVHRKLMEAREMLIRRVRGE